MKRRGHYLSVGVAILLITGVFAGSASAQRDFDLRARNLRERIPQPTEMLGILELSTGPNADLTISRDDMYYTFPTEPKIKAIDPDGPAAGILRRGDTIVAIDGLLITTRQAGRRYAALKAGEPVKVTVRRGRRHRTLTIVPREPASSDSVTVPVLPPEETIALLDSLLGSIDRYVEEIENNLGQGSYDPSSAVWQEAFGLGLGLSFRGSLIDRRGKDQIWIFNDSPLVKTVEPGSPADIGGIRPWDVLTHIDGTRLTRDAGGREFSRIKPGQTITWTVERDGRRITVETTLPPGS